MAKGMRGTRGLVIALGVLVPATALAHAELLEPPPREANDGVKVGPCGTVPRGTAFTQLQPGQQLTVKWKETIDHSGCFDILFSPANDQNWVRLTRIPDEGGTPNRNYQTTVTLPNTTCASCTLAMRQIMLSSDGKPADATRVCNGNDPDSLDGGAPTYFACANIRVGDFPDAAPSTSSSSGGTTSGSSSSGASSGTTAGSDGGSSNEDEASSSGSPNFQAGKGEDCSVGWGAAPGASAFAAGVAALVLARRRRLRRR